MNNILYIGLNGLAGSGKDTVAKILNIILMQHWSSIEMARNYYENFYTKPNASASYYEKVKGDNNNVMCLAFADQLKTICSDIFGIPLKCFYFNKSTAWICVNKGFEYTEVRPEENVISCEDYYYNIDEYKNSNKKYWMSLRDILVYVGTYILQVDLNKNVFVNIIDNKINIEELNNKNLKYAIITDVRFYHELDYIKKKNGFTIKIIRNSISQLPNIAEHEFDDEDNSFDYIIENNGSKEDLFKTVWNLVHNNLEFNNETINLDVRENINNYLRKIETNKYKVCSPYGIQQIAHNDNGDISMIDLKGGPTIDLNNKIPGTELIPIKIEIDEESNKFFIYTKNKEQL